MSKIPKYFKVEVDRKGAGIKVTPIFDDDNIVEVVRCKDCVYCNKEKVYHRVTTDDLDYKEYYRCNRCMWYFSPDDFCSYGERRESND